MVLSGATAVAAPGRQLVPVKIAKTQQQRRHAQKPAVIKARNALAGRIRAARLVQRASTRGELGSKFLRGLFLKLHPDLVAGDARSAGLPDNYQRSFFTSIFKRAKNIKEGKRVKPYVVRGAAARAVRMEGVSEALSGLEVELRQARRSNTLDKVVEHLFAFRDGLPKNWARFSSMASEIRRVESEIKARFIADLSQEASTLVSRIKTLIKSGRIDAIVACELTHVGLSARVPQQWRKEGASLLREVKNMAKELQRYRKGAEKRLTKANTQAKGIEKKLARWKEHKARRRGAMDAYSELAQLDRQFEELIRDLPAGWDEVAPEGMVKRVSAVREVLKEKQEIVVGALGNANLRLGEIYQAIGLKNWDLNYGSEREKLGLLFGESQSIRSRMRGAYASLYWRAYVKSVGGRPRGLNDWEAVEKLVWKIVKPFGHGDIDYAHIVAGLEAVYEKSLKTR
ncbi:MAG: hypothetical protein JRH20_03940 [Deltaproteobacteria bacterium]|nr:hypothetical protein [Deltaproteobacteria bacterium]